MRKSYSLSVSGRVSVEQSVITRLELLYYYLLTLVRMELTVYIGHNNFGEQVSK